MPSHRFNSATGEQKWITQTIYTDSEQPIRLPNSLMPSAKQRSANLPFFTSLVWRGRESNPGLPHPERTLLPLWLLKSSHVGPCGPVWLLCVVFFLLFFLVSDRTGDFLSSRWILECIRDLCVSTVLLYRRQRQGNLSSIGSVSIGIFIAVKNSSLLYVTIWLLTLGIWLNYRNKWSVFKSYHTCLSLKVFWQV